MTAIHPQLENIFQAYLGDGRPLLRKRVSGVTRSGFADTVRAIIDTPDAAQQKRALLTTRAGLWLRGQFPSGTSLDEIVEILGTCRKGRTDTTNKRTTFMMKRSDKIDALATIAKADGGLVSVLRAICKSDEPVVSESEVITLISDAVARDNETAAQAFSRAVPKWMTAKDRLRECGITVLPPAYLHPRLKLANA